MTSNQNVPDFAELGVAPADPLSRKPLSPNRARGVVVAFGTLFCVFAIANSWPLILAAVNFLILVSGTYRVPIVDLPAFSQWTQRMNGTWIAEFMLTPMVLLIEGPRFWKLCLVAVVSYFALLFLGLVAVSFMLDFRSISDFWRYFVKDNSVLYTAMFVSVFATCTHFRLVRGWRLVGRHWSGTLPPRWTVRFGLRHTFIVTAVFGGLLALSRSSDQFRIAVVAAMIGQAAGLPLLAMSALLLGTRKNRMTTWIDWGLISTLVVFLGTVTFLDTGLDRQITTYLVSFVRAVAGIGLDVQIATASMTCYADCAISLLWLRLWGLRLRCDQSVPSPAAAPAISGPSVS